MRKTDIRLTAAALALLLSGCAGSAYDDYFKAIRSSFSGSFSGQGVTRQQAAATPYASLGYRVDGEGPEHLLVLATDNNGGQLWTSANHVVLSLEGGRITRSVGLPHDLSGLAPKGGDHLPPLAVALAAPYTSTRSADFADIGAYSVQLTCNTVPKGPERIAILGTAIATLRVDESCTGHNPDWSFTDSYWLDSKTGNVWRTRQHLHPSGETVDIEIFRPPG